MTQLPLGILDTCVFAGELPMRSTLPEAAPVMPSPRIADAIVTPPESFSVGWNDIVAKVSTYLSHSPTKAPTAPQMAINLTELLRLQMDVTRYQLRVEVVSKIAESGVASLRKLQQAQ
jgi:hypothetical protein